MVETHSYEVLFENEAHKPLADKMKAVIADLQDTILPGKLEQAVREQIRNICKEYNLSNDGSEMYWNAGTAHFGLWVRNLDTEADESGDRVVLIKYVNRYV